jgi:hypothetical protein
METGLYIRKLAEFVTGEINLPELKQFVEDRLFELRQFSEMTDEKRILSSVELFLHEVEEKIRGQSDLYAHIQSKLDNIILARPKSDNIILARHANIGEAVYFSPNPQKLPYFLSGTFDIDPPAKQPTITKELSLTASK